MNSIKLKIFQYAEVDQVNDFIATVDLAPSGIALRDQGIILTYTDKRTEHGMTLQQHVDSVMDEIAKAESEVVDAHVGMTETKLGYKQFHGKSGMKKIADAYFEQSKKDFDTLENKKAKLIALRTLLDAINNGEIKIGSDAVSEVMDNDLKNPLIAEQGVASPYAEGEKPKDDEIDLGDAGESQPQP